MRNQATDEQITRVLRQLGSLRQHQQELEYEIIRLINQLGVSLDRIGEAHEPPISRQRVRKRYDKPKPRRGTLNLE